MEPVRIGPLAVRASGGSDRRGGGDGPAIVLCHGFGAPGDDLVPLARVIDAGSGVRWFFPEAPGEVDLGWGTTGRAWWPIDMVRLQAMLERGDRARMLADETPAGLGEARAALEATLHALARDHGVDPARTLLGGFSQGAMLATEVALHAERPFAGIALLSGTLLCADRWEAAARKIAGGLHALQSHGRADPLLPFEAALALKDMLVRAGAKVEWVPHGGQHEIPPGVLERLAAFARARFGA